MSVTHDDINRAEQRLTRRLEALEQRVTEHGRKTATNTVAVEGFMSTAVDRRVQISELEKGQQALNSAVGTLTTQQKEAQQQMQALDSNVTQLADHLKTSQGTQELMAEEVRKLREQREAEAAAALQKQQAEQERAETRREKWMALIDDPKVLIGAAIVLIPLIQWLFTGQPLSEEQQAMLERAAQSQGLTTTSAPPPMMLEQPAIEEEPAP